MFALTSVLNEVVQEACPLLTGTVLPPLQVKSFAGSENVTVPSFTVVLEVTVAVKVTELPGGAVNDGLLFELTDVAVGAARLMGAKLPVTVTAALGMWKLVLAEVLESKDPPPAAQPRNWKPRLAVAVTGIVVPDAKYCPEAGVTEPAPGGKAWVVN